MSRVTISGTGAVSPAGWGVAALMEMLRSGVKAEDSMVERKTADDRLIASPVARVPKLMDKSLLPKNPRLRRTSPIGKFAAAAAFEALGPERLAAAQAGEIRVGVICSLMNGCVNYSNRFYGEVLGDPAFASPILFPETVYNAPSSHLSAILGSMAPNDTLVGDGAEIFTALEVATEWLLRGDCEVCVVVAPEEIDWLSAEAVGLRSAEITPSEGAGAVVLELDGNGPTLLAIPDPVSYSELGDRTEALRKLRGEFSVDEESTLLADSRIGVAWVDAIEDAVFGDWKGARISTKSLLGDALGASASLQLVAAVEMLKAGEAEQAMVTSLGGNEQAGGCLLGR
ncbi:beta-ketoacyl synthase N-terminal-like domain-containing protein [Haloferula chungangensis]|uniref:Beta-ketoacyl synthase N-terminal-like domain-containing protein n=1 Tax=Haloferula chungangensis TaxID=1048331 RepID=A0ABW2L460_9BACT